VPQTVVGEGISFVGAGPEAMLLEHVLRAATPDQPSVEATPGSDL